MADWPFGLTGFNWHVPARHTAPGSGKKRQSDNSPDAASAASRSFLNWSARTASAAPSVLALDHGKYACGPPQGRAPMGSVWHWELSVQAASPINARILASVSLAGALGCAGALAVAAQATHVTQASSIRKGKGRINPSWPEPLVGSSAIHLQMLWRQAYGTQSIDMEKFLYGYKLDKLAASIPIYIAAQHVNLCPAPPVLPVLPPCPDGLRRQYGNVCTSNRTGGDRHPHAGG